MVGTAESSRAWGEVVAHDARFEFPDVVGFADGGPGGAGWHGGPWAAEGRLHRMESLPKRGGGIRRLATLDPAVHARYRALVAGVAGPVERSLGSEVVGGRCCGTASGLVLEPWRPAWRRHLRRVRRMSGGGPLVRLDVRDCFGSIRAEVVADALRRCGADRPAVVAVCDLLLRFEADGIPGLPVGPEPSAVLANAALASADRAMRSLGLPFVRWCDDVTFALGAADADAVEQAWTAALEPLWLRPAPEKTRVVGAAESAATSGPRGRAAAAVTVVGRTRPPIDELCQRARHALDGPDPHSSRVAVALVGRSGGRQARQILRHVRTRAPHLAPTAEWGLRR